ncbi:Flp family type IVb pilin [Asticcacaulis sp. BYS171W]|uniref:Flp family type IVb pilin n=1 Tax=Asticcacaulis aquaticus TaxID=2984212 RepID=A0ABT5HZA0_9CAUL|nr:Flp family type IVb pilin [Asticcacaulis aquaticus]MDC7685160.1 Flp family type IVb pilin [Asticcacaulis aquaticus]
MKTFLQSFAKDESGATAIEYGLIAALIAVALITVLGTMKDSLVTTFTKVSTTLDTASK